MRATALAKFTFFSRQLPKLHLTVSDLATTKCYSKDLVDVDLSCVQAEKPLAIVFGWPHEFEVACVQANTQLHLIVRQFKIGEISCQVQSLLHFKDLRILPFYHTEALNHEEPDEKAED